MSIAKSPSVVSLPEAQSGVETVLDYLVIRFASISAAVWRQRMIDSKVHWHDGSLISIDTPYRAKQRVYYYREVDNEIEIPFKESIVFQNEHLVVVHKPHFLPVTPGGKYVNQCLLARLREATQCEYLQPLHRLDRVTAGLVMFSNNVETCPAYSRLFEMREIHKTYLAVACVNPKETLVGATWEVKNRIEPEPDSFKMRIVIGQPNSHSIIQCIEQQCDKALFELNPITGKTHQLRLHMQALGWPILNDKTYPVLQPEIKDDYTKPLQLLAKRLSFVDPVSGVPMQFKSDAELVLSSLL